MPASMIWLVEFVRQWCVFYLCACDHSVILLSFSLLKENNGFLSMQNIQWFIHLSLLQYSFGTVSYVGYDVGGSSFPALQIARDRRCYCNRVNRKSSCWDKSWPLLLLFMRWQWEALLLHSTGRSELGRHGVGKRSDAGGPRRGLVPERTRGERPAQGWILLL